MYVVYCTLCTVSVYKAAVISPAPYIYTHIFLLYFFFKNLSPLSLYTHKRLDDIISQACYRYRRHIPEERHTHKVHTISHKLLQGGGPTKTPPGHTQTSYNFIQYHTHNRPEPFTIKDGCCLILFRLDLGLSED